MPKFTVTVERRFWQLETADLEIEAKDAADARRIAKKQFEFPDAIPFEPSDSGYDHYKVEDVEKSGDA